MLQDDDGGRYVASSEVDLETAQEIARVGMVATTRLYPVGHVYELCGQRFVVTGRATREEFLRAVEAAGLPRERFAQCPVQMLFDRVSTD